MSLFPEHPGRALSPLRPASAVVLWLSLAVGLGSAGDAAAREAGPALEPGQPAPAWRLPSPSADAVAYPAAAAGRPSVLLFWATWCPYCKALMPHLQAIREEYRDAGVQVVAVSVWEDGDPAAVVAEEGYDFVLALDGDQVAWEYGVTGTPGLFVVDGDGNVVMNRRLLQIDRFLPPLAAGEKPSPGQLASAWASATREALGTALSR